MIISEGGKRRLLIPESNSIHSSTVRKQEIHQKKGKGGSPGAIQDRRIKNRKRTNKKIENPKKNGKSTKNRKTWKSPNKQNRLNPEKSDLARGDGALESQESELQADAH